MKKFYVYKVIFEDGRYYIGYRGSTRSPEYDLLQKYMTSSKKVKRLLEEGNVASPQILRSEMDQKTAYELEQHTIFQCFNDPLCLNDACYYGRSGFGVLSETAKAKISEYNKMRWQDPSFREMMSERHRQRWESIPELRERQKNRLTGVKRPQHSKKMKGRTMSDEQKVKLRKPKHSGHGAKVSASTKGKSKSAEHKEAISLSRMGKTFSTRQYNPVIDHREVVHDNPGRFAKYYKLSRDFFDNLDVPIRYSSVYEKLGIPHTEEYRSKTKRELGFRFQEVLV